MIFAGDFETHLTIGLPAGESAELLRAYARGKGLKLTHIVLSNGDWSSQPMLTRHGKGTLDSQLGEARGLARDLKADGLEVVRIKIEAAVENPGVPADDAAATKLRPEQYFEHHVKLLLDSEADLARLAELVRPHGARLSRNALRTRDDGKQERFVTQRCHRAGRATAARKLAELLAAIASAGFVPLEVEEEFVVYDDRLSLDSGWIGQVAAT